MKIIITAIFTFLIIFVNSDCVHQESKQSNLQAKRWEKLTEDSTLHSVGFSRIKFFDSKNGLGLRTLSLEKTDDGGKTWQNAFDGDLAAYSMVFTNTDNGWLVGTENKPHKFKNEDDYLENHSKSSTPLILETKDRGSNWQKIAIDEKSLTQGEKRFSLFYDICFDKNGKSWIVGDAGVAEAKIEGRNLQVSNVFYTDDSLFSVYCTETGDIWAVGAGEIVLHYKDSWSKKAVGNETFLKKDSGYVANFYKVKIVDNDIWLVGSYRQKLVKENEKLDLNGVLFRSRNNGETWENKTPDPAHALYDIYFDGKNGWLVGENGGLYATKDGGDSWIKQESHTTNDLLNIFFLDSDNGWISGDKRTILHLIMN